MGEGCEDVIIDQRGSRAGASATRVGQSFQLRAAPRAPSPASAAALPVSPRSCVRSLSSRAAPSARCRAARAHRSRSSGAVRPTAPVPVAKLPPPPANDQQVAVAALVERAQQSRVPPPRAYRRHPLHRGQRTSKPRWRRCVRRSRGCAPSSTAPSPPAHRRWLRRWGAGQTAPTRFACTVAAARSSLRHRELALPRSPCGGQAHRQQGDRRRLPGHHHRPGTAPTRCSGLLPSACSAPCALMAW
eukprot:COSAG01_NODE_3513_length_5984_cov_63.855905_6_plen_245_part_00